LDSPKIVDAESRRLIGKRIVTTMAEDQTMSLWKSFKPLVGDIALRKETGFFSVQKFDPTISFYQFTPFSKFEKWAAVEVEENYEMIPFGLEPLLLNGGKYAVFIHKGKASKFPETLQYIFGQWMPNSGFELDKRHHFEIMDTNYQPTDPSAEEEVWIPIKEK